MFSKVKFNQRRIKNLTDTNNIVLSVFCLLVLAITWSGINTLQNNYQLQKQVSELQQQNTVLSLENQNSALANEFYETDQYLDISARQNLGLAAPGETELLIPKSVALKYVDQSLAPAGNSSADNRSTIIKNWDAWRDFLLGRKAVSD